MRVLLARHRGDILQVLGGLVVVIGVCLGFGVAAALIIAGIGITVLGVLAEGGS